MPTERVQYLIHELDGLLDKENAAILGGDLDMIRRLLEAKRQLVGRINDAAAPGVTGLPALRVKLARNQDLLRSAMQGVKSVAERLAALRAVQDELLTYDATGRKSRHRPTRRMSVEKRT
jgi:flagellar biosynthesis/type III secretory pathway chaperone